MFVRSESDHNDSTHLRHQDLPVQPKSYGTAEDSKRLKDWAVSVVKYGLDNRGRAHEVSAYNYILLALLDLV